MHTLQVWTCKSISLVWIDLIAASPSPETWCGLPQVRRSHKNSGHTAPPCRRSLSGLPRFWSSFYSSWRDVSFSTKISQILSGLLSLSLPIPWYLVIGEISCKMSGLITSLKTNCRYLLIIFVAWSVSFAVLDWSCWQSCKNLWQLVTVVVGETPTIIMAYMFFEYFISLNFLTLW